MLTFTLTAITKKNKEENYKKNSANFSNITMRNFVAKPESEKTDFIDKATTGGQLLPKKERVPRRQKRSTMTLITLYSIHRISIHRIKLKHGPS